MSGGFLEIRDADGNPLKVVAVSSNGFKVSPDGTVTRWHEDENGREEWTEQLCDSPIRDVFAPWVWDALEIDP